jgi:hypothetical protein
MTTDIVCFYLQNRLIQTSQTGGQWYSDTPPFSIPCYSTNSFVEQYLFLNENKTFFKIELSKIPYQKSLSKPVLPDGRGEDAWPAGGHASV